MRFVAAALPSSHEPSEASGGVLVNPQNFFDTDHPIDPHDSSAASVSNVDLTAPGDAITWALLDTSKVVKPFIFPKRKDYTFIRKDQDGDDNVFFRNEHLYGVEARVNAGYGLWQLAYGSNKTLDSVSYAAARKAMMELKAACGKPLGITPDLMLCAPRLPSRKPRASYSPATGTRRGFERLA